MAIRKTINYTVTPDNISPNTYQNIGIQTEHNVTDIVFNLSDDLYNSLVGKALGGIIYRFDGYNGNGEVKSSDFYSFPPVNTPITYSLEEWLTHAGGNIKVVLIITDTVNDKTNFEYIVPPALLRTSYLPENNGEADENRESVSALAATANKAAKRAENAAGVSEKAAKRAENAAGVSEKAAKRAENAAEVSEKAEANTKAAEKALTEGTFIFLGGDANGSAEVELIIDSELSKTSTNPIQNAAVAKEFGNMHKDHMLTCEILSENISNNAQKIEKNASDIKGLQDSISEYADYPIEIGENGIWDYTKYKSGRCKMWGITEAVANITSAFGTVFRSTVSYSEEFPFEFEEPPVCLCDISAKGNWAVSKFSNETATVNRTCTVYASRPEGDKGNAVPIVIHWKVIGNLKTEE